MDEGERNDQSGLPGRPASGGRIWLILLLVAIGGLAVTLISALVGILT